MLAINLIEVFKCKKVPQLSSVLLHLVFAQHACNTVTINQLGKAPAGNLIFPSYCLPILYKVRNLLNASCFWHSPSGAQ